MQGYAVPDTHRMLLAGERAVKAPTHAFASWRDVAPHERGRVLLRIAEVVEARAKELARIIATDTDSK